jgi:hypothetical protein
MENFVEVGSFLDILCVKGGGGSIIDMVMECGSERWDEKMIKKNEKKG